MGNEVKRQSIYNGNFSDKVWQEMFPGEDMEMDSPILMRTTDGTMMADQYIFQLHPHMNFENQSKIYTQRASSQSDNLVNILSAEQFSHTTEYSIKRSFLKVKTERILFRLTNTANLTIQEALYFIEGICSGQHQLHQHFPKLYNFSETMAGINQNGRIKIWLNSNFGKNYLSDQTILVPHPKQAFLTIIEAVQKHIQGNVFPAHIKNTLLQAQDLGGGAYFASWLLNLGKQQKRQIGKGIISKNMNKMIKHKKINYKQIKIEDSELEKQGQVKIENSNNNNNNINNNNNNNNGFNGRSKTLPKGYISQFEVEKGLKRGRKKIFDLKLGSDNKKTQNTVLQSELKRSQLIPFSNNLSVPIVQHIDIDRSRVRQKSSNSQKSQIKGNTLHLNHNQLFNSQIKRQNSKMPNNSAYFTNLPVSNRQNMIQTPFNQRFDHLNSFKHQICSFNHDNKVQSFRNSHIPLNRTDSVNKFYKSQVRVANSSPLS